MSSSKETVNEEQKTDKQIVIQPKSPVPTVKRKFVDASPSAVKHVKIVEEKADTQTLFCGMCNKKLKFISTFTCRCQRSFCVRHRFHDQHDCTFDYKKEARNRLSENNPKVAPKKMSE